MRAALLLSSMLLFACAAGTMPVSPLSVSAIDDAEDHDRRMELRGVLSGEELFYLDQDGQTRIPLSLDVRRVAVAVAAERAEAVVERLGLQVDAVLDEGEVLWLAAAVPRGQELVPFAEALLGEEGVLAVEPAWQDGARPLYTTDRVVALPREGVEERVVLAWLAERGIHPLDDPPVPGVFVYKTTLPVLRSIEMVLSGYFVWAQPDFLRTYTTWPRPSRSP